MKFNIQGDSISEKMYFNNNLASKEDLFQPTTDGILNALFMPFYALFHLFHVLFSLGSAILTSPFIICQFLYGSRSVTYGGYSIFKNALKAVGTSAFHGFIDGLLTPISYLSLLVLIPVCIYKNCNKKMAANETMKLHDPVDTQSSTPFMQSILNKLKPKMEKQNTPSVNMEVIHPESTTNNALEEVRANICKPAFQMN